MPGADWFWSGGGGRAHASVLGRRTPLIKRTGTPCGGVPQHHPGDGTSNRGAASGTSATRSRATTFAGHAPATRHSTSLSLNVGRQNDCRAQPSSAAGRPPGPGTPDLSGGHCGGDLDCGGYADRCLLDKGVLAPPNPAGPLPLPLPPPLPVPHDTQRRVGRAAARRPALPRCYPPQKKDPRRCAPRQNITMPQRTRLPRRGRTTGREPRHSCRGEGGIQGPQDRLPCPHKALQGAVCGIRTRSGGGGWFTCRRQCRG